MQVVNLHWHIKTLIGRVFIERFDTQQHILIWMVEMTETRGRRKMKVFILARKKANTTVTPLMKTMILLHQSKWTLPRHEMIKKVGLLVYFFCNDLILTMIVNHWQCILISHIFSVSDILIPYR